MRKYPAIQNAMLGINAVVVGLLIAAFYNPVWTSSIPTSQDFGLALLAILMLMFWKVPPRLVVIIGAILASLSVFVVYVAETFQKLNVHSLYKEDKLMKKHVAFMLCSLVLTVPVQAEEKIIKSQGWLMEAESDQERFKLLQKYLRGFDQPMWEVGERYQSIHEALSRNNYDLASYHWDKIKTTIENGYMKRPNRQHNAETIFLNSNWSEVKKAFDSHNQQSAIKGFNQAKAACMACHIAESVPFMNNQSIFDLKLSTTALDNIK